MDVLDMEELLSVQCSMVRNTPWYEHTHIHTHTLSAFWGCSQSQGACQVWLQASSGCTVCVGEAQGCSSQCCLPCACLLYFPFVSWSGNHRLIPVRSCKCLPLLDQTQKNSSRWLQCIYIPQVITRWCSPLYSFPHVKAEILARFSFFSPLFLLFSRLLFF